MISINKIKASVAAGDDEKSHSDAHSEKSHHDANVFAPEIHLQPPFQPGASPVHLLSRFMVNFLWKTTLAYQYHTLTSIVCYT